MAVGGVVGVGRCSCEDGRVRGARARSSDASQEKRDFHGRPGGTISAQTALTTYVLFLVVAVAVGAGDRGVLLRWSWVRLGLAGVVVCCGGGCGVACVACVCVHVYVCVRVCVRFVGGAVPVPEA